MDLHFVSVPFSGDKKHVRRLLTKARRKIKHGHSSTLCQALAQVNLNLARGYNANTARIELLERMEISCQMRKEINAALGRSVYVTETEQYFLWWAASEKSNTSSLRREYRLAWIDHMIKELQS